MTDEDALDMAEEEIRQLKNYIGDLESLLIKEGYTKVCSYCELACVPIWSKGEGPLPSRCELCDEGTGNER